MAKLKEDEAPQSHIDEFKAVAQTGMKFIMKDIKDYDVRNVFLTSFIKCCPFKV